MIFHQQFPKISNQVKVNKVNDKIITSQNIFSSTALYHCRPEGS